ALVNDHPVSIAQAGTLQADIIHELHVREVLLQELQYSDVRGVTIVQQGASQQLVLGGRQRKHARLVNRHRVVHVHLVIGVGEQVDERLGAVGTDAGHQGGN